MTLLLTAVLAAGMTGCGNEEEVPRYSYIACEAVEENSVDARIAAAIEQEAEAGGYRSAVFEAEEATLDAINEQFEKAAEQKARLIIASGERMEIPVYVAQNKHHGIKYVLLEGVPRGEEGAPDDIRKNTMTADFMYAQEGFIAGYAAVRNGYRQLACMAGERNDVNTRYCGGFVQGAEYAAAELELAAGEVSIQQYYTNDDSLTPVRMSQAMELYEAGVEMIFSLGENITLAVDKAAYVCGGMFMTAGQDLTMTKGCCLLSVIPDYEEVFRRIITAFEEKDGFKGGGSVSYGISDNCINISVDYSRFSTSFTQDNYNSLISAFLSGDAVAEEMEILEGNEQVRLVISEAATEEAGEKTPEELAAEKAAEEAYQAEKEAEAAAETGETGETDEASEEAAG